MAFFLFFNRVDSIFAEREAASDDQVWQKTLGGAGAVILLLAVAALLGYLVRRNKVKQTLTDVQVRAIEGEWKQKF